VSKLFKILFNGYESYFVDKNVKNTEGPLPPIFPKMTSCFLAVSVKSKSNLPISHRVKREKGVISV
jgi:hypothetical protein